MRKTEPKPKQHREPREPHPDLIGINGRLIEAMSKANGGTGITGKELSEASGVEESGITRIRKGDALVGVTADTVLRLARALGVSPSFLLAGERPEPRTLTETGSGPQRELVERALDANNRHKAHGPKGKRLRPSKRGG